MDSRWLCECRKRVRLVGIRRIGCKSPSSIEKFHLRGESTGDVWCFMVVCVSTNLQAEHMKMKRPSCRMADLLSYY